ncbi:hypothetical protein Ac2012v2_001346 [Leucoagaricus gongylophorus]
MVMPIELRETSKVSEPQSDLRTVLESEIKYDPFLSTYLSIDPISLSQFKGNGISVGKDPENNSEEHQAALKLRDAVLRLRRDGAFVAVPLFRVNTGPIGPHPVAHDRDHQDRVAWLGQSYGLDLSTLPVYSEELPSQYSALRLGYTAPSTLSIEDRLKIGANVEAILSADKDAAKAPPRNPNV